MPLTAEQIAKMDAALGVGAPIGLTPERINEMDAALGASAQPQVQPEAQKPGLGGTVFDQGMQGATFGFADEVSDRLGAVWATLLREPKALITGEITDPGLSEEVANVRKTTQGQLSEQMKQRPVASILSNIGGGIATGGAGATTRAGAALGNFLRSGNAAIRAVKGVGVGAAAGALSGAGSGVDGDKAGSAGRGALLGGAVGTAAPVLGSAISGAVKGSGNIARGISSRGGDALDDAADALRNAGTKSYSRMRAVGASFTPQSSQRIVQNIDDALLNDGPLNPRLHDKVSAVMDDIRENGFESLEQLDQWRQVLNDVAGNFSDKVNQRKARVLIDAIDDEIENIQPGDLSSGSREAVDALLDGRKFWARRARFETVSDIVKGASGDANKLKRDLERLRLNKKKTAGWNADELQALEQASTQTTGEGALKLLGKFGFDLGSGRAIGNTGLPVIGGILTGVGTGAVGPAAAVPIVGTVARAGQKAVASGKAETLLRTIESGGKVTQKQVMALPPKQAEQVLIYLRSIGLPATATVYQAKQE